MPLQGYEATSQNRHFVTTVTSVIFFDRPITTKTAYCDALSLFVVKCHKLDIIVHTRFGEYMSHVLLNKSGVHNK